LHWGGKRPSSKGGGGNPTGTVQNQRNNVLSLKAPRVVQKWTPLTENPYRRSMIRSNRRGTGGAQNPARKRKKTTAGRSPWGREGRLPVVNHVEKTAQPHPTPNGIPVTPSKGRGKGAPTPTGGLVVRGEWTFEERGSDIKRLKNRQHISTTGSVRCEARGQRTSM